MSTTPQPHGYSPAMAQKIKDAIDLDMARIEDLAGQMRRRVTDHSLEVDKQLEELREVAHELKAIIDRRTKPEA